MAGPMFSAGGREVRRYSWKARDTPSSVKYGLVCDERDRAVVLAGVQLDADGVAAAGEVGLRGPTP